MPLKANADGAEPSSNHGTATQPAAGGSFYYRPFPSSFLHHYHDEASAISRPSRPASSALAGPLLGEPTSGPRPLKPTRSQIRQIPEPLTVKKGTQSTSPNPSPIPLPPLSSPSLTMVSSPSTAPPGSARHRPMSLAGMHDLDDLLGTHQHREHLPDAHDSEANRQQPKELHDSPPPTPVVSIDRWAEFSERLRVVEETLSHLLKRGRAGPPGPEGDQPSGGDSSRRSHSDDVSQLDQLDANFTAETPANSVHVPVPHRATTPSDKQAKAISMPSQAPSAQPDQAPLARMPLIHRPVPRAHPRSSSPVFEEELSPRLGTFPAIRIPPPSESSRPFEPLLLPPKRSIWKRSPPIRTPQSEPTGSQPRPKDHIVMTNTTTSAPFSTLRLDDQSPDINFDRHAHDGRTGRSEDTVDWVDRTVPSHPMSTSTAVLEEGGGGERWNRPVPTVGARAAQVPAGPLSRQLQAVPQPPQFAQVAPVPTIAQLLSTFDDITDLLRDNRQGQLAGLEQQGELLAYSRTLNQWLERDVHDRHAEIQSVSARLEQTRDEVIPLLNQIARAVAWRQEGTPAGVASPPGVTMIPGVPRPTPRVPALGSSTDSFHGETALGFVPFLPQQQMRFNSSPTTVPFSTTSGYYASFAGAQAPGAPSVLTPRNDTAAGHDSTPLRRRSTVASERTKRSPFYLFLRSLM